MSLGTDDLVGKAVGLVDRSVQNRLIKPTFDSFTRVNCFMNATRIHLLIAGILPVLSIVGCGPVSPQKPPSQSPPTQSADTVGPANESATKPDSAEFNKLKEQNTELIQMLGEAEDKLFAKTDELTAANEKLTLANQTIELEKTRQLEMKKEIERLKSLISETQKNFGQLIDASEKMLKALDDETSEPDGRSDQ